MEILLGSPRSLQAGTGAEGVVCAPGRPTECAVPLSEGQEAPFAGQLLTPSLALKLGQGLEGCMQRWDMERQRLEAEALIQEGYWEQRLKDEQAASGAKQKALERALQQSAPSWYEKPWFVASLSIVLTALTIRLIALR